VSEDCTCTFIVDSNEYTCEWTWDVDGFYQTSCGHAWTFEDYDGLAGYQKSGFLYCPYCANTIRERKESEAGDE